VYRIVPDEAVIEQLAALPPEALAAYADLVDVLERARGMASHSTRTTLTARYALAFRTRPGGQPADERPGRTQWP
jgi:hypothetical protein